MGLGARHTPEVLADVVARIRRSSLPKDYWAPPVFSDQVHEIPRDEVAAAVHHGIFEIDRHASAQLQVPPSPSGAST